MQGRTARRTLVVSPLILPSTPPTPAAIRERLKEARDIDPFRRGELIKEGTTSPLREGNKLNV